MRIYIIHVIVILLLQSVMTATGKFQVAPLAEAALSGHLAVAEVLVENGAYVQNRSGVRFICGLR